MIPAEFAELIDSGIQASLIFDESHYSLLSICIQKFSAQIP